MSSDYLFPWANRYHNRIKDNSLNDQVYCGRCLTTHGRYACDAPSYEKVKLNADNPHDAKMESRGRGHLHL